MRILPVFLGLGLLLAACNGGDPVPSQSPSPAATSASPSASPDPAAEAEAAVRAYYAEVNRAASTGQVTGLEGLTSPSCSCRRLVSYIRQKWTQGSLRGAVFTTADLRVLDASPAAASVRVRSSVTRYEVLDRAGRVIETVPAASAVEVLELRPTDRGWIVANIVRTS